MNIGERPSIRPARQKKGRHAPIFEREGGHRSKGLFIYLKEEKGSTIVMGKERVLLIESSLKEDNYRE